MPQNYNRNVFINCPFDETYMPLFDAALFSVYECGFQPRCALEIDDSGQTRIQKISDIIKECRIGIHDISKTELDTVNNLPRFNMPLELGLFLGAMKFGSKLQKSKITIIFDKEQYRYQKFISDISGQDIKEHRLDVIVFIKLIRNALNAQKINPPIVGADSIIKNYQSFQAMLPMIREQLSLTTQDITYTDKIQMIEKWLIISQNNAN